MRAVEGAEVLHPIVLRAIREVTGQRYLRIESFNDSPYTRHAEILRAFERARQLVVSGWNPVIAQAGERAGWSAVLQALRASFSHACAPSHSPAG